MKVFLLIAFIGLALTAGDRFKAVEQSIFGKVFGGIKDAANKVKDGVTDAGNKVKEGVTTGVDKTKEGINTAVDKTKEGVNTGIRHTTNGVNTAIDHTKNGINTALDHSKKAVVDQAINNGVLVGVHYTKREVLKGIDESKKAFVTFGRLTEQTSKKFANDVKKVAVKTGKILDPRQITKEQWLQVLEGVRLVTGPLQVVLTNPMVEQAMAKTPWKVQVAYKLLVLGVKCTNDPENWQQHLLDVHPISKILGTFVINTINDPDNWQEHLIEAAPAMGEALMEIAAAHAQGKKKMMLEEKPSRFRSLVKHFSQ